MNTITQATNLFKFFYLEKCGNIDCSELELNKVKEAVNHIRANYLESIDYDIVDLSLSNYKDINQVRIISIIETCLDATDSTFSDLSYNEFFDLILEIESEWDNDDFYIDSLPCGEVRIIKDSAIDEIWTESLIELVEDCYDLSDVPGFVVINWEQTAENCKVDGMGHHFASYDHEEHEAEGYYIFRTN